MITRVELENYRGHTATAVPVGRLTVLVGPNASGKTSVLNALRIVGRCINEAPNDVFGLGPAARFLRHGQEQASIHVSGVASAAWKVSLYAQETPLGALDVRASGQTGSASGNSGHSADRPLRLSNISFTDVDRYARGFPDLVRAELFQLNARRIAEPSPLADHVAFDGANVASVLAELERTQAQRKEQIVEATRSIVPSLRNISVVRVPRPSASTESAYALSLDFAGAERIPGEGASTGTLTTLALITILYGEKRPNLLLLDDIEQGLHPQAQMALVRQIRRVLDANPDLQIIATTHSPYILDELALTEVQVFAVNGEGLIRCRPLTDHPVAKKGRGPLAAGQVWSLRNEEKWIFEDAAPAENSPPTAGTTTG